jgi:hypothetical protein
MRRFFIISLALALIAVGLHVAALSQYAHAARSIALAITQPESEESERAVARQTALVYRERGSVIAIMGLGVALASLTLVVLSARGHEPAWRSITVAFLVFYLLLQFAHT